MYKLTKLLSLKIKPNANPSLNSYKDFHEYWLNFIKGSLSEERIESVKKSIGSVEDFLSEQGVDSIDLNKINIAETFKEIDLNLIKFSEPKVKETVPTVRCSQIDQSSINKETYGDIAVYFKKVLSNGIESLSIHQSFHLLFGLGNIYKDLNGYFELLNAGIFFTAANKYANTPKHKEMVATACNELHARFLTHLDLSINVKKILKNSKSMLEKGKTYQEMLHVTRVGTKKMLDAPHYDSKQITEYISNNYSGLLQTIQADAMAVIEIKGPFVVLNFGSIGQKIPGARSDYEFGVLVNNTNIANREKIVALCKYMTFLSVFAGESVPKIKYKPILEYFKKGFSFDDVYNPAINDMLIGTPKDYARTQSIAFSKGDILFSDAIGKSSPLRGLKSFEEQKLCDEFERLRSEILVSENKSRVNSFKSKVHQQRALNMLEEDIAIFEPKLRKKEDGSTFDGKTDHYRFLSQSLNMLALFYGVSRQNIWNILPALRKKEVISEKTEVKLFQALDIVAKLRIKAHLFYGVECETLWHHGAVQENESEKRLFIDSHTKEELKLLYSVLLPFFDALKKFVKCKGTRNVLKEMFCKEQPAGEGVFDAPRFISDNLNKSTAVFENNLALDPNDLSSLQKLGVAYLQQNKFDEAITYLSRAFELASHEKNMGEIAKTSWPLANAYTGKGELSLSVYYLEKGMSAIKNSLADSKLTSKQVKQADVGLMYDLEQILMNIAEVLGSVPTKNDKSLRYEQMKELNLSVLWLTHFKKTSPNLGFSLVNLAGLLGQSPLTMNESFRLYLLAITFFPRKNDYSKIRYLGHLFHCIGNTIINSNKSHALTGTSRLVPIPFLDKALEVYGRATQGQFDDRIAKINYEKVREIRERKGSNSEQELSKQEAKAIRDGIATYIESQLKISDTIPASHLPLVAVRGQVLFEAGQFSEAKKIFLIVLKSLDCVGLMEKNAIKILDIDKVRHSLGKIYKYEGKFQLAIEQFSVVAKGNNEDLSIDSMYQIAVFLKNSNQENEALKQFNKLKMRYLKIDPNHNGLLAVYTAIGNLHMNKAVKTGSLTEKKTYAQQSVEFFKKAIEINNHLKPELRTKDLPIVYLGLGNVYKLLDIELSIKYFKSAYVLLALGSQQPSTGGTQSEGMLEYVKQNLCQLMGPAGFRDFLIKGVKKAPDPIEIINNLIHEAETLKKQKKYFKAANKLESAKKQLVETHELFEETYSKIIESLFECYVKQANLGKATQLIEDSINNPNLAPLAQIHASLKYHQGELNLLKMGMLGQALSCFLESAVLAAASELVPSKTSEVLLKNSTLKLTIFCRLQEVVKKYPKTSSKISLLKPLFHEFLDTYALKVMKIRRGLPGKNQPDIRDEYVQGIREVLFFDTIYVFFDLFAESTDAVTFYKGQVNSIRGNVKLKVPNKSVRDPWGAFTSLGLICTKEVEKVKKRLGIEPVRKQGPMR